MLKLLSRRIISFSLIFVLVFNIFSSINNSISYVSADEIGDCRVIGVSILNQNSQVNKGDCIQVQIEIESDNYGVTDAEVVMQYFNGTSTYQNGSIYWSCGTWNGVAQYNGTIVVEVPTNSNMEAGEWHITSLSLGDSRNKWRTYNATGRIGSLGYRWIRLDGVDYQLPTCELIGDTSEGKDSSITSVSFVNSKVERPGTVQIEIGINAEDYGVVSANVVLQYYNGKSYQNGSIYWAYGSWEGDVKYDGTITINIPMDSNKTVGEWHITSLAIEDTRDYWTSYSATGRIGSSGYRWIKIDGSDYMLPSCELLGDASEGKDSKVVGVSFEENEVIRPGVVKVNLEIEAEDYGVNCAEVVMQYFNGKDYTSTSVTWNAASWEGATKYNGIITVELPMDGNKEKGEWHITSLSIKDTRDYWTSYRATGRSGSLGYRWIKIDGSDYMLPTCTICDEYEYCDQFDLSNPNIVTKLKNAEEGKAVRIFIDNDSKGVIPKEAFDSIKGRDVTIVAYQKSYQWIFRGTDITEETKDIDLLIDINNIDETVYDTGEMAVEVDFQPNGVLPGEAEIRIKSDYLYDLCGILGRLFLYYINNGKPELQNNPKFDLFFDGTDKWCNFSINHNSKYIVSGSMTGSKKHINTSNNSSKSISPGLANTTKTNNNSKKYSNEWINGKWYNKNGIQTYKYTLSWKCNSTGWWVEDSTGWYPHSQWQKIDGKWYYFTADGYMDYSEYRDGCWLGSDGAWDERYSSGTWHLGAKGWWYSDGSWYPANQSLWVDGVKYHFNSEGYWDY